MESKPVIAMQQRKLAAEAEVRVLLRSRRELKAAAAALTPEATHPAGNRAEVRVQVRGNMLRVRIGARDSSALRAVMTSYLRMLKAISNVFASLADSETRKRHGRSSGRRAMGK